MVNIKTYNCEKQYNKSKKIFIFRPLKNDFKIQAEYDDKFSFCIKTKNELNFDGNYESFRKDNKININVNKKISIYGNNNELIYFKNFKINRIKNLEKIDNTIKTNIDYNNFNDYFDIFYINLDERVDRNVMIIDEFKKSNITNYNRFSAFKPNKNTIINSKILNVQSLWPINDKYPDINNYNDFKYIQGCLGCKMSHYTILKNFYTKSNKKYLIIFEDDCILENNLKEKIINTINYIEIQNILFNILYMSLNIHGKNPENNLVNIDDNLLKIKNGYGNTSHALIFDRNTIKNVLKSIKYSDNEIDNVYKNISDRYVFNPMVTYQREDLSDIGQFREIYNKTSKGVFYGDFSKKYNLLKLNNVNNKYIIYVKNNITNINNINLYNYLKNNYDILEVNKLSDNQNNIYLIFNYDEIINFNFKYILINDNFDLECNIINSIYSIVNSIELINKYISNYKIYSKLLLNNSEEHMKILLLSLKLDDDYQLNLNSINFNVLTLPTSQIRLDEFKKNNIDLLDNFNIIEGIKYNPGFIGCGLSYKMIINNASRLKLEYIKICEDDCKINNFNIIDKAINYLQKNNIIWELLSCFIVDINSDLEIYEQIELDSNYKLLKINQWTSTVCNVYSKLSFNYFDNYLKKKINKNEILSNTIDRNLLFKDIWVIYPYPIELINSKSEIWLNPQDNGYNYNNYIKLLKKSNNIINNKLNNIVNKTIYDDDIKLYIKIIGGFGNQLFMIFNIISLSKEYNKKFQLYYDENYASQYLKDRDTIRKESYEYEIFKNLNFKKIDNDKLKEFQVYNEPEYIYNKINLEENKKYYINGYFQSYKYFWDNKEEIKKYLYINYKRIYEIENKLKIYKKKILAIHIRLGDYVKLQDFHPILSIDYYKKALSYYNLENYQIILFSDDILGAKEKLKELNLNFISANELYEEDEDQFYILCLSDVRICANSSFSLMSCYLNEIYNFKENCKYIFPNKWFGKKGPNHKMSHIIPIYNNKFKIIYYEKCAVIFFHKNIYKLYQKYWIDKCVDSILNQQNCDFDIFEINYGNENDSIFNNKQINNKHHFYVKNYDTHTEAMIFLLNKIFNENNYDIVFNTNLDDYYDEYRFIYQLNDIIENNSYINSTLWTYITQNKNLEIDEIYDTQKNTFVYKNKQFLWEKINNFNNEENNEIINYEDIKMNLINKHNVLNHSGICFTKKFWNSYDKYGNKLRYRDDKPYEDISLWIRCVENNIKVSLVNKSLIYYRIHKAQIGTKSKNIENLDKKEKKEFKKSINFIKKRNGILKIIDKKEDIINIFNDNFHHYFIYINEDLIDNLIDYVDINNIYCYNYISYKNKIYDYDEIIKLFDVNIELMCDTFEILNYNKIIFYTCYYIVKSKFDSSIYIEWGIKMLKFLKNYELILFTDKKSYELLKNILINYSNVKIIIKELEEFELYKYIDFFEKNTSHEYFPYHDISKELILIWINRHLFLKELKNKYYASFYSYLDFGYLRNYDNGEPLVLNIDELNKDKIYLGLIKNDKEYLKQIYDLVNGICNEKIQYLLKNNLYSIGGGGNIISYSKVDLWMSYYENILMNFIDNKIDFKDDQTIIISTLFNKYDIDSFDIITIKNDWFPFIKFLINNNDKDIIHNNFDFL